VIWTVNQAGALALLDFPTLQPLKLFPPLIQSCESTPSSLSKSSFTPTQPATSPPTPTERYLSHTIRCLAIHSPEWHIISPNVTKHTTSTTGMTATTSGSSHLNYFMHSCTPFSQPLIHASSPPYFKIISSDKWTAAAFSPDNLYLVVGTSLGKLLIWRVHASLLFSYFLLAVFINLCFLMADSWKMVCYWRPIKLIFSALTIYCLLGMALPWLVPRQMPPLKFGFYKSIPINPILPLSLLFYM
jgi:hypothetical protein